MSEAATVINNSSSGVDFGNGHSHSHAASYGDLEYTPQKLAMMKLNSSLRDDDVFSDPGTPHGRSVGFRGSHSLSRAEGRSSLSRTTRQVSNTARRSANFMHSHRSKMSAELTTQAESKFFSLIELMTSASREASSLKEYWSKLMSDRESFDREREDLLTRIEEVSETLEEKESQQHHHGRELAERRKEVEKLLVDLADALNGINAEKRKVAERDHELERTRAEISEARISSSRLQIDHDKVKADLEGALTRARNLESERDHARQDAEKHRTDLRIITREHTEIKSKYSDITTRLEHSRKEVSTLNDRIKSWERERDTYLLEKDRLQEELRKVTTRSDELLRELTEATDRYERLQREFKGVKESIRYVETERDDHAMTIDRLRVELRNKTTSIEDVENRLADVNLKHEQAKRELVGKDDRLRDLQSEIDEVRHHLEHSREEHRTIIVERDSLKDDLDGERHKHHESHRKLTTLQETLRHTEATLAEVRSEVASYIERIRIIERERDDHHHKHDHVHGEFLQLKERITLFQAEIKQLTDARDKARSEIDDYRRQYEEITETITESKDDSAELEFEIESLRTMLREAREQKERAIAARATADRERDEWSAKYEEKCREMERWEENKSAYLHSHAHSHGGGSRTTSTRVVSRNGTSSSYKHEHNEGQ